MDSCPNEILGAIVEFLPEQELFNLRLIGRRLQDVATRSMFSRLVICDNIFSVRRFRGLITECEDDRILTAVETVLFDGTNPDHFELGREVTTPLIEAAFSLLYRLPNLQSLRLAFFPDSVPDPHDMMFSTSYYVEVQLAFWTALSHTPLPRLSTLHIGSMVSYFPRQMTDTDPFLAAFRLLTSLHLSVVLLFQDRILPIEIRGFRPNVTAMLAAANNLTSLELGADVLAGMTSCYAFEKYLFPALTSLKLHTVVFAGLSDKDRLRSDEEGLSASEDFDARQPLTAETFILNHRATLEYLHLEDCAVALPDGKWHHIFRRFQFQLLELIEFVWTTHSSQPDENFLYRRAYGALQTYVVGDDDFVFMADDPQDVGALEALQSAALSRKNSKNLQ